MYTWEVHALDATGEFTRGDEPFNTLADEEAARRSPRMSRTIAIQRSCDSSAFWMHSLDCWWMLGRNFGAQWHEGTAGRG
jgi:hypothetical protein